MWRTGDTERPWFENVTDRGHRMTLIKKRDGQETPNDLDYKTWRTRGTKWAFRCLDDVKNYQNIISLSHETPCLYCQPKVRFETAGGREIASHLVFCFPNLPTLRYLFPYHLSIYTNSCVYLSSSLAYSNLWSVPSSGVWLWWVPGNSQKVIGQPAASMNPYLPHHLTIYPCPPSCWPSWPYYPPPSPVLPLSILTKASSMKFPHLIPASSLTLEMIDWFINIVVFCCEF